MSYASKRRKRGSEYAWPHLTEEEMERVYKAYFIPAYEEIDKVVDKIKSVAKGFELFDYEKGIDPDHNHIEGNWIKYADGFCAVMIPSRDTPIEKILDVFKDAGFVLDEHFVKKDNSGGEYFFIKNVGNVIIKAWVFYKNTPDGTQYIEIMGICPTLENAYLP